MDLSWTKKYTSHVWTAVSIEFTARGENAVFFFKAAVHEDIYSYSYDILFVHMVTLKGQLCIKSDQGQSCSFTILNTSKLDLTIIYYISYFVPLCDCCFEFVVMFKYPWASKEQRCSLPSLLHAQQDFWQPTLCTPWWNHLSNMNKLYILAYMHTIVLEDKHCRSSLSYSITV